MLSMPAGTDPLKVQGAVRQFGREAFGGRFDYVFALHTDVDHPHVHMAVRSLGEGGKRLNPRKADLDQCAYFNDRGRQFRAMAGADFS
jgi:type IV secretory pathway VirD2 relaxase